MMETHPIHQTHQLFWGLMIKIIFKCHQANTHGKTQIKAVCHGIMCPLQNKQQQTKAHRYFLISRFWLFFCLACV